MARRKWQPGPEFQRSKETRGGRRLSTSSLPAGAMNRSEERYAREYLDPKREAGEILTWAFQPIRLRLAKSAIFTPDFLILYPDGTLTLEDFKGHQEESALVRIKVAASLYWWWRFRLVKAIPKKDGGGYRMEDVAPWTLDGPTYLAATIGGYDVSRQGVLKWGTGDEERDARSGGAG